MRALIAVLAILTLCSACASCSPNAPKDASEPRASDGATEAPAAPDQLSASVELFPVGRAPVLVRVELARTPAERQRGLMYRKELAADTGMLFLFEGSQQLTFWMRNTYVALDMIFIESSLRVLGVVENAEPQTDTTRSVPGLSQYVLEVNAGFSREHGIGPGTKVRYEGVPGL